MNITGGANISLYEVQEAADIVASASDEEVNMIFGSVINDALKEEILVTVIATGFNEQEELRAKPSSRPSAEKEYDHTYHYAEEPATRRQVREPREYREPVQDNYRVHSDPKEESLDTPAFLRNRRRR